jgi:hypothetical protein
MYDVDYETKDYGNAIKTIEKINPFDSKFKEDLTSLYMSTSQFDKALQLNELNESSGSQIRRIL